MATRKKKAVATPAAARAGGIGVAEALRAARRDLVIERDTTYEVGEDEGTRVTVASVEDLQRLSLLPERLKADALLKAVAADSAAALEQARRMPPSAGDCGCDGDDGHAARKPHPVASMRTHYAQVRRRFHPALSQLLAEAQGHEVAWDSPTAVHAHRWVEHLQAVRRFEMVVLLWQDLTVGHNATLQLAPTRRMLWARNIRIHTGGRIRTTGSYLKIKCASIQGNLA